jgi:hypothetical protein
MVLEVDDLSEIAALIGTSVALYRHFGHPAFS